MIEKIEMYGVVCDKCGELLEDAYTGCVAWSDEQGARERGESNDWIEIGDKWYCPKFYKYDENLDEYVINE